MEHAFDSQAIQRGETAIRTDGLLAVALGSRQENLTPIKLVSKKISRNCKNRRDKGLVRMTPKDNKKPMGFYPLVQELEKAIGNTTGVMELIELVNLDQFNEIRCNIIQVFQVGDIEPYSGEFGEEVEFGDISDAVRETTFSLYPQSTPMDKSIDHKERLRWCQQIICAMDSAAEIY